VTPAQVIARYDAIVRSNRTPEHDTLDSVASDDTGEAWSELQDVADEMLIEEKVLSPWPGDATFREVRDRWRRIRDDWWENPGNQWFSRVLSHLFLALQETYKVEVSAEAQNRAHERAAVTRHAAVLAVLTRELEPRFDPNTLVRLADAVLDAQDVS